MLRYDKDYDSMTESPDGEWVRFEEAKEYFKAPQNTIHNSEYVSQAKSCLNCKDAEKLCAYRSECSMNPEHPNWQPA